MALEVVTSASWPSIAIIGAIAAITYALYRSVLLVIYAPLTRIAR